MKCNSLKVILVSALVLSMFGCKTISIHQASQTNTTQQVTLGSIGSEKEFLLQKEFNGNAVPNYKSAIKLAIITKLFTKQTYKAFTKAKALQSADINIYYVDSIPNKPTYIQLQIVDKVAVINALNNQENKEVKAYVSHNTDASVLTSISMALNQNDIENIASADAVFLIEKGLKTYVLQLYKDDVKTQTIQFNQGVVFEYKTSSCCWKKNKTQQLNIVDLVGRYNDCPNGTYRSLKRAQKTINYYKL